MMPPLPPRQETRGPKSRCYTTYRATVSRRSIRVGVGGLTDDLDEPVGRALLGGEDDECADELAGAAALGQEVDDASDLDPLLMSRADVERIALPLGVDHDDGVKGEGVGGAAVHLVAGHVKLALIGAGDELANQSGL